MVRSRGRGEGSLTESESGINILFRWVPAHQGVSGNEVVDKYAKRACDKVNMTSVPSFKRDVKRIIKESKRMKEESQFENFDAKFKKTFLPTLDDMRMFLKASPSVTVCQLVSGHTRLNKFMCNKIGLISSPKCKCGMDDETVTHFLFECSLYDDIRNEVWPELKMEYSFIAKDWGKLEKYVELSGRFKEVVK